MKEFTSQEGVALDEEGKANEVVLVKRLFEEEALNVELFGRKASLFKNSRRRMYL